MYVCIKLHQGSTIYRIPSLYLDTNPMFSSTFWGSAVFFSSFSGQGCFQLEFVSISRVINHMTCYKFECSHWCKIYFLKKRFALQSECCNSNQCSINSIYNKSCDLLQIQSSHWLKLHHLHWKANLVKDFFKINFTPMRAIESILGHMDYNLAYT